MKYINGDSISYVYEEVYGSCNINANSLAAAINWACHKHHINHVYGLLFACGVHKVLQGTTPEQFLNGIDYEFKEAVVIMYSNLEGKEAIKNLSMV